LETSIIDLNVNIERRATVIIKTNPIGPCVSKFKYNPFLKSLNGAAASTWQKPAETHFLSPNSRCIVAFLEYTMPEKEDSED
jgi:hypothetical protein